MNLVQRRALLPGYALLLLSILTNCHPSTRSETLKTDSSATQKPGPTPGLESAPASPDDKPFELPKGISLTKPAPDKREAGFMQEG